MNRRLHGNCSVPIAGYCREIEPGLELTGLVGDADSGRLLRACATGSLDEGQQLGEHVAQLLLDQGAGEMLGH
jgi:hydroxymethylbilane synthase